MEGRYADKVVDEDAAKRESANASSSVSISRLSRFLKY